MNASPVIRYKVPRYPTRLEVQADPGLLEKHLPAAWKSHAEMAGLISVLLAANSCADPAQNARPNVTAKPAVVAPIFVHGEGRGAVGCVVVNPPVFLSEQDAMQVIREELSKAGVTLSQSKVTLQGVNIPQHREEFTVVQGRPQHKVVPTNTSKTLVLSGADTPKKVGIEYLNAQNYFELGGEKSASTVQGYDFQNVAGEVNKQVKEQAHNLYFETFYDPVVSPSRDIFSDRQFRRKLDALYAEEEKATDPKVKAEKEKQIDALYDEMVAPDAARSKELLRLQVKDFVDWLKGQGVIRCT